MLPMLDKHSLITAALLATLTTAGCGQKKDLIAPPPAPAQTQPQNNQPAPKADSKNAPFKGGGLGGGLPDPNAPESEQPSPLPPENTEPVVPSKPPVIVETKPTNPGSTNKLPDDYNANDPHGVTKGNLTKRLTGAVTQEGLLYTSTSTDGLLDFLRARNERVDYNTRRMNLEVAAAVRSAVLSVDPLTGDAVVTVKVKEGREVKVYNLAGVSTYGGVTSTLRAVREGNGEKSTGRLPLEGTLKCVDLDGGCETTFVRLRMGGAGNSTAIINLVFRNSSADLYFHLPSDQAQSQNPEFLEFQDYILNSIKKVETSQRINTVRMSSWEVVNGRSGVTLSFKGHNNELLAFAGPLLAPETGSGVNVVLSRLGYEQDTSLNLMSSNSTKLNYANWIGEATMIANNGLGQVRVALKMRKRGTHAQDVVLVTFMRMIKPIVDLTDDNLK